MRISTPASTDGTQLPRLLTPRQVAELIGASERTVRRLAQDGTLDRVRIGHRTSRYTARSVLALIDPSPTNEQRPGGHRGAANTSDEAARDATGPP